MLLAIPSLSAGGVAQKYNFPATVERKVKVE
jgi:hypothetical protein